MAASKRHVSGGAETYFAKKLASNEKSIRDKAVKKLRIWISARRSVSNGLTESDMLKLWKGLFYCMWMSDKPKVQEELAETIAQLLHSFQITTTALDYLNGFYTTICREWHGIDRLRLDKFYMLIRKFVYQSFVFMKNYGWKKEVVENFNQMLENGPLSNSNESLLVPDGVKTHIIQVYLEELLKCGAPQIPHSVLLQLLQPIIRLLATSKNKVITNTVCHEIIDQLMKRNLEDQQNECSLKVDLQVLSDQFFSWASRKDIPARNRHILYKYIEKFKIISKENVDDKTVQQWTQETTGQCNGTNEESTDNNFPVSMDIDEYKEGGICTEKSKEGEECKQNGVDKGGASLFNANEVVIKKSKKKEKFTQDCTEAVSNSKMKDNIDVYEDRGVTRKLENHVLNECMESNKTGKKIKGVKRKGVHNTCTEENNDTTLNEDVKSIKKKKRMKSDENKMCDEIHGVDAVNKKGKKKKKVKNKFVVGQNSNKIPSQETGNDLQNKQAERSGGQVSESLNCTFDSLDGSYLSTLPKQEQKITPFETTKPVGVFKNDKSDVEKSNAKGTPCVDLNVDSMCVSPGDKITNESEELMDMSPESMPLAIFLRHSQKKVNANAETKAQEKRNKIVPGNQASSGNKKKVRIELSKNTSHSTRDYRHVLKSSPVIPFDAKKKPVQSSLKTPPTSGRKKNTSKHSSQSQRRPTASDFF